MEGKRPLFGRCRSRPTEPDPGQLLHGRHYLWGRLPAPQLGVSALEARGSSPANTGDTVRPRAQRGTRPGSNGDVRGSEPANGSDHRPALAQRGWAAEVVSSMRDAKDFS